MKHINLNQDRAMTKAYEGQLKNCPATETISLKKGAQVILLKNLDPEAGLVNGSRGVIIDFRNHPSAINDLPKEFKRLKLPLVLFENDLRRLIEPGEWSNKIGDSTVSSRVQIPLRLAWALSVHKSQGMTIPHLSVNLRGVFEYGQAYVALSRATKLSLLTILGLNASSIRAHPKVKIFYDILEGKPAQQPQSNITPPRQQQSQPSLTKEQMQRIEENRKRALEIQRQRQLQQHQQ